MKRNKTVKNLEMYVPSYINLVKASINISSFLDAIKKLNAHIKKQEDVMAKQKVA